VTPGWSLRRVNAKILPGVRSPQSTPDATLRCSALRSTRGCCRRWPPLRFFSTIRVHSIVFCPVSVFAGRGRQRLVGWVLLVSRPRWPSGYELRWSPVSLPVWTRPLIAPRSMRAVSLSGFLVPPSSRCRVVPLRWSVTCSPVTGLSSPRSRRVLRPIRVRFWPAIVWWLPPPIRWWLPRPAFPAALSPPLVTPTPRAFRWWWRFHRLQLAVIRMLWGCCRLPVSPTGRCWVGRPGCLPAIRRGSVWPMLSPSPAMISGSFSVFSMPSGLGTGRSLRAGLLERLVEMRNRCCRSDSLRVGRRQSLAVDAGL